MHHINHYLFNSSIHDEGTGSLGIAVPDLLLTIFKTAVTIDCPQATHRTTLGKGHVPSSFSRYLLISP